MKLSAEQFESEIKELGWSKVKCQVLSQKEIDRKMKMPWYTRPGVQIAVASTVVGLSTGGLALAGFPALAGLAFGGSAALSGAAAGAGWPKGHFYSAEFDREYKVSMAQRAATKEMDAVGKRVMEAGLEDPRKDTDLIEALYRNTDMGDGRKMSIDTPGVADYLKSRLQQRQNKEAADQKVDMMKARTGLGPG